MRRSPATRARSPSAPGRAIRRTRRRRRAASGGSSPSTGSRTSCRRSSRPPFPGYVSGHSTFSRAAAEVMTAFTGSEYFPGGAHGTRSRRFAQVRARDRRRTSRSSGRRTTTRPTTPGSRASMGASTSPPTTSTAGGSALSAGGTRGRSPKSTSTGPHELEPGHDRRRNARLRLHGQGALPCIPRGVATSSPRSSRASSRSPGVRPRRWRRPAGSAGRRRRRTGESRWPTTAFSSSTTADRTTFMPSRRSRRRETASMSSARSRSGGRLRKRTRSGARRRRRRRAHVRLQLPLRACRTAGARDRRVRRPRRALPLPRSLPPVLGWRRPPSWRFDKGAAGSGAIGDLGAHIVDLGRYLIGEHRGERRRPHLHRGTRGGRQLRRDGGVRERRRRHARGVASRHRADQPEHLRDQRLAGSIAFDVERLNELQVATRALVRARPRHGARAPFMGYWWPPGHIVGWGDTFTHEIAHLLAAIAGEGTVAPHGATFEDGYRCAEVCDAILRFVGERQAGGDQLPMKTSLGIWAFGSMVTRFVPGGYQPQWAGETTVERVARAVDGLGDLIDDYEFHYPQELSEENLDEVREALGGHGIYCIATGLHLDPRFGRGGLSSPDDGDARRGGAGRARGGRLRGLARRALHHLAGDRGLQLPVPDAVCRRRGRGSSRESARRRSAARARRRRSSSSTRTRSRR